MARRDFSACNRPLRGGREGGEREGEGGRETEMEEEGVKERYKLMAAIPMNIFNYGHCHLQYMVHAPPMAVPHLLSLRSVVDPDLVSLDHTSPFPPPPPPPPPPPIPSTRATLPLGEGRTPTAPEKEGSEDTRS